MISTISGELREQVHFIDAIKNAFPMGSMTGAPKIKAMQLIEKYEVAKRGVFSGAVGYITPNGDFDFNVVIRSIFYNQLTSQLSFQAGSAITYDSIPEQEYDECMLKVKAILAILGLDEENLHEDIESSLTNYWFATSKQLSFYCHYVIIGLLFTFAFHKKLSEVWRI